MLQKRWRGRESVCEYKKYKELRQLEIINSKGSGVRRKSLLGLRVRIRLTAAFELQPNSQRSWSGIRQDGGVCLRSLIQGGRRHCLRPVRPARPYRCLLDEMK